MSKCTTCRKNDALDSWWDKAKEWLIYKLFPKVLIDFHQEKYTQGFGDGYKKGFEHAYSNMTKPEVVTDPSKLYKMYEKQD